MIYLAIFLAGAIVGGWVCWRWGFNAAVLLYRDWAIDAANQRAEQDRR